MEDRSWDMSLASSRSHSGEDRAVEGCKQTNASDEARVFVAMYFIKPTYCSIRIDRQRHRPRHARTPHWPESDFLVY